MKFKIAVNDLQYAMRLVKDVVPTTGPLAETSGVHIKAGMDRAVFSAFNTGLITQVTVKIDGAEEGEAAVSAALLHSAISRFQAENDNGIGTGALTITASNKAKKFTISTKTRYASGAETPHKRVFPLLNPEFFPDFNNFSVNTSDVVSLPGAVIMDGIDCVSYALSSDKNNMLFTGVYLKATAGKGLTFAATNGICLAEYTAPFDYTGPDVDITIPGPLANKIARSFFDEDVLVMKIDKKRLSIGTPNLLVGGSLIQEEYPDYSALLPEPSQTALIDHSVLMDNLLNLNYEATTVEDSRVAVIVEGGDVCLRCGGSENSGIKAEGHTGLLKFEANLKLLTLSLKNLTGNTVKLGFTDDVSPIHLSSTEKFASGATLRCVLVPLTPEAV